MNAIAFCLDLILATLLMAALYVGLRLDKKLRALKDSYTGFAGAVAELNAAVVKAQEGLAGLRATATQVETSIADKIQDARGMTARLEQQSAAANAAAEKLERLLERYPSNISHPRDRDAGARSSQGGDPGFLALRDKIAAARAPGQPLAREALSRALPAQERNLGSRLRGDERGGKPVIRAADDELFDIIEPALKAARGSGR